MKKILINYYLVFVFVLFMVLNFMFYDFEVEGLLYTFLYDVLFILNIVFIVRNRKSIKFKVPVMAGYLLILIFCKDIYYVVFDIANVILLGIMGILENGLVRVFSAIILGLVLFFSSYMVFFLMLVYIVSGNDIYEDTHYYCNDNYEIYSYSGGAFDGFHYSIGKHYEFMNIDGIIEINYSDRNEVSEEKYNNFLKTHSCKLVGDGDGTKKNS